MTAVVEDEFAIDFGDELKSPSEMNTPELILFYGKAGSGKTRLAASICEVPGINKVLLIDTEGSANGTVSGFPDDKLKIISVDTRDKFNELLSKLCNPEYKHPFDAVIIDTFDVAQDREAEFKLATVKNEKGVLDGRKAWGEVKKWSIKVPRMLKAAGFVGIIVTHETTDKLESGSILSTVMLSGAAKDVVPGIPDIIGYTVRKVIDGKEQTTVDFAASTTRATKNRYHLPAQMLAPSMTTIYEALENNNKENK